MNWFRDVWETLNEGTNMQGFALIGIGAYLTIKGQAAVGGAIITGGFTLLNNSKKKESNGNDKSEAASK